MRAMIERLRSLGVPDAAIPGVLELIDEQCAEAIRPRTSTERSRKFRKGKQEDATKTLQIRPVFVPESLHPRPEIVASDPPLACAFSIGEEVSILPPEKATLSTPKGDKPKSEVRGSRLPEDWRPNDAGRALAVELLGSNQTAHAELAKFADFWRAKAGAQARKSDWDAAWRYWIRNAGERHQRAGPQQNGHGTFNGKISLHDALKDFQRELEQSPGNDLFAPAGDEIRASPARLLSAR